MLSRTVGFLTKKIESTAWEGIREQKRFLLRASQSRLDSVLGKIYDCLHFTVLHCMPLTTSLVCVMCVIRNQETRTLVVPLNYAELVTRRILEEQTDCSKPNEWDAVAWSPDLSYSVVPAG
jgi:hypothetical protein